ncbi:MAG: NUDIX hydrolase [Rhodospirillales bacterium]|nr:NUDIX hydrolase [Rhodospirillales bacterium]
MVTVHALSPNVEVIAGSEAPALPPALEAEVTAIWNAERARRYGLVDGLIFSVERFSAARIEGRYVPYRRLVAQRADPTLFADLRVRPLAVSGVLTCKGGIVFGRRAADVADDPGRWELVPSGGVSPDSAGPGRRVDLGRQICAELAEEVGLKSADVSSLKVICAVEDDETRVIDVGIAIMSPLISAEILARHGRNVSREYSELAVVSRRNLTEFVTARAVIPVSRALLEQVGFTFAR